MENLSNKISLMKSTINKIKNELTSIQNVLDFINRNRKTQCVSPQ